MSSSKYNTTSPHKNRKADEVQTNLQTKKQKNRNQFSFCDQYMNTAHNNSAQKLDINRTLFFSNRDQMPTASFHRDKSHNNSINHQHSRSRVSISEHYKKQNIPMLNDNHEHRRQMHGKLDKLGRMGKLGSSSIINYEQMQLLHNQHRIQIQKLLLQISRLHDTIHDIQLSKNIDINRIKQQHQRLIFLQLTSIKQNKQNQAQQLQRQIKIHRSQISKHQQTIQNLQSKLNKQQKTHQLDLQNMNRDLKQTINTKNNQIFAIKQHYENKLTSMKQKNQDDLLHVQQSCEKEIKKLYKQVEHKEKVLAQIENNTQYNQSNNSKVVEEIQYQRDMLENKISKIITKNQQRYEQLENSVQSLLNKEQQNSEHRYKIQKSTYQAQIDNLMLIIKHKQQQIANMQKYFQTKLAKQKIIHANAQEQTNYYKQSMKKQKQSHLREMQQLKARMAILHQNDIKQLVNLYETKIENSGAENVRLQNQIAQLHKYVHEESHRWHENKKKYQIKISRLSVQIMKLKAGFGDLEKNMNDRIQNQRSALLLTSQNLIRDAQLKTTNVKFYEDELRKLRQLLDLQTQEHAKFQQQNKSAYKILEEENLKLNTKIKELMNEQSQIQAQCYEVLHQKDEQIRKLNNITHQLMEKGQENENVQLKQLNKCIAKMQTDLVSKDQKLKELNKKIYSMERKISDYKSENEQLFLENQINQQQAKSQYAKIVDENLCSLKKFYEKKIEQLQLDKEELFHRNSMEAQTLSQLIKKYNELEKGMKEMVRQAKKKSELEKKIINLGMDNNLVKNKAELFKISQQLQQ